MNEPSSQLNNDRVQPEQSSKKGPSSRDYVRSGERSKQLNPVRQPKASTGQKKPKGFSAHAVFSYYNHKVYMLNPLGYAEFPS